MALVAFGLVSSAADTRVSAQAPGVRTGDPQSPPDVVQLRPGDGVRIEIKDEKDLSGEFEIGIDGSILLPAIGSIRVAERPFDEVERDLRSAYGAQLLNPVLRVTPLVRIAVLGEVRQPGLLLVDPTHAVADVLARAGGLLPSGNQKRIAIRTQSGTLVGHYDFTSPAMVQLSSGDQIMVPRRGWMSENLGIFLGAAGSVAVALITAVVLR